VLPPPPPCPPLAASLAAVPAPPPGESQSSDTPPAPPAAVHATLPIALPPTAPIAPLPPRIDPFDTNSAAPDARTNSAVDDRPSSVDSVAPTIATPSIVVVCTSPCATTVRSSVDVIVTASATGS